MRPGSHRARRRNTHTLPVHRGPGRTESRLDSDTSLHSPAQREHGDDAVFSWMHVPFSLCKDAGGEGRWVLTLVDRVPPHGIDPETLKNHQLRVSSGAIRAVCPRESEAGATLRWKFSMSDVPNGCHGLLCFPGAPGPREEYAGSRKKSGLLGAELHPPTSPRPRWFVEVLRM